MIVGVFDGIKEFPMKSGGVGARVFYRALNADGTPVLEQSNYSTFRTDVVSACRQIKPGEMISVDLIIKDAVVNNVSRVDLND